MTDDKFYSSMSNLDCSAHVFLKQDGVFMWAPIDLPESEQ